MGLILVDTSVWVDHIRRPEPELVDLIRVRRCVLHPFALAEVVLGNLPDWPRRVAQLRALPSVQPISDEALLAAIQQLSLQGSGLGFVDAHLLASCRDASEMRLWTRDKRLADHASRLNLFWRPV